MAQHHPSRPAPHTARHHALNDRAAELAEATVKLLEDEWAVDRQTAALALARALERSATASRTDGPAPDPGTTPRQLLLTPSGALL